MKKLNTILLGGLATLAISPIIHAIGLEEIKVNSGLGQPFRAQVPIHAQQQLDVTECKAKLATRAEFKRIGLTYDQSMDQFSFSIKRDAQGKPYISIRSDDPIADPFLTFLLEFDTPSGNLIREYTVLLDPPSALYVQSVQQHNAQVPHQKSKNLPSRKSTNHTPRKQHPKTNNHHKNLCKNQVNHEHHPQKPHQQTSIGTAHIAKQKLPEINAIQTASSDELYFGPTIKKDDLWKIASGLPHDPSINNQQIELAIFYKNPGAFSQHNINSLKTGVLLNAPTDEEMHAFSKHSALREVAKQNRVWQSDNHLLNAKPMKFNKQRAKNRTQHNKPKAAIHSMPDVTPKTTPVNTPTIKFKSARVEEESGLLTTLQVELTKAQHKLDLALKKKLQLERNNKHLVEEENSMHMMLTSKSNKIHKLEDEVAGLQSLLAGQGVQATGSRITHYVKPIKHMRFASNQQANNSTSANQANIQMVQAGEIENTPFKLKYMLLFAGFSLLTILTGSYYGYRRCLAFQNSFFGDDVSEDAISSDRLFAKENFDNKHVSIAHNQQTIELDVLEKVDIYLQYQRYEKAVNAMIQAIKANPTSPDLYKKLLEVYAKMGDKQAFDQAFQYLIQELQYQDNEAIAEINALRQSTWADDQESSQDNS